MNTRLHEEQCKILLAQKSLQEIIRKCNIQAAFDERKNVINFE